MLLTFWSTDGLWFETRLTRAFDIAKSHLTVLAWHQVVKYFTVNLHTRPDVSAPYYPDCHSYYSLYSPLRQRESLLSFSSIIRLTWAPPPCEQISCAVFTFLRFLCVPLMQDWFCCDILEWLDIFYAMIPEPLDNEEATQRDNNSSLFCRVISQRQEPLLMGHYLRLSWQCAGQWGCQILKLTRLSAGEGILNNGWRNQAFSKDRNITQRPELEALTVLHETKIYFIC